MTVGRVLAIIVAVMLTACNAVADKPSNQHAAQIPAEKKGGAGEQPGRPFPRPEEVHLVPLPVALELPFRMLYPAGWQIDATQLNDLVQIRQEPIQVNVQTYQLRERRAPLTVESFRTGFDSLPAGVVIRQLSMPGVVSAFEFQAIRRRTEGDQAELHYALYGTTYQQHLWFLLPARLYHDWEPLFRKIFESLEPANLNATPIPGRP